MKRRDKIPFSAPSKRKPKPAVVIGIVSSRGGDTCIVGLPLPMPCCLEPSFQSQRRRRALRRLSKIQPPIRSLPRRRYSCTLKERLSPQGCSSFPRVRGCTTPSKRLGASLKTRGMTRVNLARVLTDGEQIVVPATQTDGDSDAAPATAASAGTATGKVNINTADAATLDTLPGIGASTAASSNALTAQGKRPLQNCRGPKAGLGNWR